MAKERPILRAGTKLLIRKDGKLATSCCPQVYLFSRNGPWGIYTYGFSEIMCFDRNTLEVLWVQRPLATYVVENDPYADNILGTFIASEAKIYNNLILCGAYGINPYSGSTPQLTVFDLGAAQKRIIENPTQQPGNGINAIHDTFFTTDGKSFILTEYGNVVEGGGSRIYCIDELDNVIASDIEYDFRLQKMCGSLESDGVFRIYVVGFKPGVEDASDVAKDTVFCYSFDGETFTKLWTYIDDDSKDFLTLNQGPGRGYELLVPQAMDSTRQQCYLISMIMDKPTTGHPSDQTVTARISVIEKGTSPGIGVLLWKWDILLNDPDPYHNIDTYVEDGCGYTFWDYLSPGWGTREAIECALLYRNCNHFLYFRGSSTKYPNTLFRLNLTTGATKEELPTISWPEEEKPHLMGVPHSAATPYQFDTILMMDRTTLHLIDVDDLTVSLATNTMANAVESQRPGWSIYSDHFIAPRMNRELKFSNE